MMAVSDWLALGALLVSALTALGMFKIARGQGRLYGRQQELEDAWREYRHGLVEAGLEHATAAQIELICYSRDRLTIRNVGGAEARNVDIACRCPNGESVFAVNEGTLPIERLNPERSVSVALGLTMQCYFPLPATVTWTDPDGSQREESVTLNLE